MTPRRYDPDLVQVRLRELRTLLTDLESLGELSAAQLRSDRIRRHAVERILIALVDLAVAVNSHVAATVLSAAPTSYADSFRGAAEAGLIAPQLAMRLAASTGMRNVLVHRYLDTDLDRVAAALPTATRDFHDYVAQAARFTPARFTPPTSGD